MEQPEVQGRITGIRCSDGESYLSDGYIIQPFGPSSFYVRALDSKEFMIIPTRCIDRIYMDEGDEVPDGNK